MEDTMEAPLDGAVQTRTKLDRATLLAEILAAQDIELHAEAVPEWNTTVYIRTLTAEEGASLAGEVLALGEDAPDGTVRMLVLLRTLVDSENRPLFLDVPDAVGLLGRKSNQVVTRLFNRAQELNGFGPDGEATAEGN